jgi:uncharacterized membrane protein YkvA (DUF1232 family)
VGSSPTPGTVSIWEWLLISAVVVVALYAIAVAALASTGHREDAAALARFVPDCLVLFQRLLSDPRVAWWRKGVLLLAILYLASPIDLVPDFIPIAGQVDDVIVMALALRVVLRGSGPALLAEHWPGPRSSLAVIGRLAY